MKVKNIDDVFSFKVWLPILVVFIYILCKIFLFNTGFFWDSVTVLCKPATYLYEHGLFHFHYPSEADNGDPQLVPFYIALMWTVFGKSLIVAHLSFIPVTILILIQLYKFVTKVVSREFIPYIFILLAVDPTFMSMSSGLYQDAFVILFSLLLINAMLDKRKLGIGIYMALLCLTSRRGILLTFAFMLAYYVYTMYVLKVHFWNTIKLLFPVYLPAVLVVFSFITWRLYSYGWFFTTSQTDSGEITSFSGVLKNILALGRWFVDEGRLFVWLILGIALIKNKNRMALLSENSLLLLVLLFMLIVMMSVTLPLKNPFGARYFAIHYMLIATILAKVTMMYQPVKRVKQLILLSTILLLSGNFWLYPEKLSQPWDSTLAYIPYFELKQQTIDYVAEKHVEFGSVGVEFPLTSEFRYIDANNDRRQFAHLDFHQNRWIVYSNIFNLSDERIDSLRTWNLIKTFKKGTVFMKIYENPNYSHE
ncbi:MAG: hypothetical protein PHH37_09735 [Paludibacter sp.]|nr:hypothetical protein [Paludibacter sp.]